MKYYIYLGYFESGTSEYVLKTNEIINPEKFKWRYVGSIRHKHLKAKRPLLNSAKEDYFVFDLKSENEWRISRSENDFIILDESEIYRNDLLDQYLEELVSKEDCTYEIMKINQIAKSHGRVETENAIRSKKYISGKSLPKIKSTKELNYVGKIDYHPVSLRNHGDVGR